MPRKNEKSNMNDGFRTMLTRSASNRTYPPRKCLKEDCDEFFIPTRKNQVYCTRQHQIDQNNDNRAIKEAPGKRLEAIYQKNQAILKKLVEASIRLKMLNISLDYMQIEGFDFEHYTDKTRNVKTNNIIIWNYQYGYEPINKEYKLITVHKR
jgi:hypothetical protein